MVDFVDRDWMCSTCGYTMNRCTPLDGNGGGPAEDDITLCMNCGAAHLRERGRWRPATELEFAALPADIKAEVARGRKIRAATIRVDLTERDGRA